MNRNVYHPEKSRVGDLPLNDFIKSKINGNLLEVPGICCEFERYLKIAGITTTFELTSKYLSLKEINMSSIEHHETFHTWLTSIGAATRNRSGIVHSIGSKMNLILPGIYDPECLEIVSYYY